MSEPKQKQNQKLISEKEKKIMMKTIEKNTEKVVGLAIQNGIIANPLVKNVDPNKAEASSDMLLNIMKIGSDVFQEKTGRVMTYGEMREMYG